VAKSLTDLGHLERGVFEHLPGEREAGLAQEFLGVGADILPLSPHGAGAHREEHDDLVGPGVAGQERRSQKAPRLLRQPFAEPGLGRVLTVLL